MNIVVLQAMAAAAVLAFFWRDRRGHSVWRVRIAPAAALAMLMYATWLIVAKMDLLTAAGPAVNTILVAVTPVSLVIGLALGTRLARRNPDLYARLGTTDVDAEPSVAPEEVSNPIPPGTVT